MSRVHPVLILIAAGLALLAHPALAEWGVDLGGGVALPSYAPVVTCATEFEGDLVVGGRFDQAGDVAVTNVARWNGTTWSGLGSGLVGQTMYSTPVSGLATIDGVLHAVGPFYSSFGASANHVARWNGAEWEPLADTIAPDLDSLDRVACLITFKGHLYIGGGMDNEGEYFELARWAGDGWDFIPSPVFGNDGYICSMAVLHDRLWVVGRTYWGHQIVANWDGESWTTVLDDESNESGQLRSVCAHRGSIYIGGTFTALDGIPIDLLARWTGSVWEPGYSGSLADGFWFFNGPEPTWVQCGVYKLLSVGDRLIAGGLLVHSSTVESLCSKMSITRTGIIESLGGNLGNRWSGGVMWPMVYALGYALGDVIIGGDFNEGDGIDHTLGCLIGQPFDLSPVGVFPSTTVLYAPVPNPFNPHTTLRFSLASAGSCRLEIYDLRGRLVRALWDGFRTSGDHRFAWNGRDEHGHDLASGIYLARLTTNDGTQARKLVLAK